MRRVSAHQAGRIRCSVVAPVDAVPEGATAQTRRWVEALGEVLPLEIRFPALPPRDAVERGGTGPACRRVLVRAADPLPDESLVHAWTVRVGR